MIEVVYNREDEGNDQLVTLPKNIRQVGVTGGSRKIYIEDYAYNFIQEYNDEGKTCVGVLLGESKVQNKERYLFIKGAMKIEESQIQGEDIEFTQEIWNEIYEGMHKYFPETGIVGWYIITSNWSDDKLEKVRKIHMDNFAGNEKTVLIADRAEGKKNFYVYENNRLLLLSGYIIYYEKNEQMQNYLVDMRSGTRIEEEKPQREKGNFRKLLKESSESEPPVKKAFVSYAANAVMIVMILFIGMYIVNSHEKISDLDDTVAGISLEVSNNNVTMTELQTVGTVPIVEISGDVYPLPSEEVSGEISVETGEIPTEVVTEASQEATVSDPVSAVPKNYATYEIKRGETLISLSKKFYGNSSMIDAIMELNDIKDRNQIYEGQIIKLP